MSIPLLGYVVINAVGAEIGSFFYSIYEVLRERVSFTVTLTLTLTLHGTSKPNPNPSPNPKFDPDL